MTLIGFLLLLNIKKRRKNYKIKKKVRQMSLKNLLNNPVMSRKTLDSVMINDYMNHLII